MNVIPTSLDVLRAQMSQLDATMILVISRAFEGKSDAAIAETLSPAWGIGAGSVARAWEGMFRIFGLSGATYSVEQKKSQILALFARYAETLPPTFRPTLLRVKKKKKQPQQKKFALRASNKVQI